MVIANDFNCLPSVDCVKKANNKNKISVFEHYNSFNTFIPFLKEFFNQFFNKYYSYIYILLLLLPSM